MRRPSLLITRPMPDKTLKKARTMAEVSYRNSETPLSAAQAHQALSDFDIVLTTLGDDFSARAFPETPKCKLIANFGVGFNHIDTDTAKACGICVTNTPGAVTDATADIALMLMLMSARRAGEGERLLRKGIWGGWQPTQLLGTHMTGKTIGVIGMGRIGQAIAKRAHFGFDMNVKHFSRSPKTLPFRSEQMSDIHELCRESDFVIAAVPATPQTYHLIDKSCFEAMPQHAIFVNIARGDVVDEAALIKALQVGEIAGAGLDVYEFEPTVPKALCNLENVTLLPHLGTATLEVREAMGELALENIKAFIEKAPLPTAI